MRKDISYLSQQFFDKEFEDVTLNEIDASIQEFPYCDLLYFFSMLKEKNIEKISSLSLLTSNPLIAFHKATESHKEFREDSNEEQIVHPIVTSEETAVQPIIEAKAPSSSSDFLKKEQEEKSVDSSSEVEFAKNVKIPTEALEQQNETTQSESLNSFLGWLSTMNTLSPQEHTEHLSKIKVQNEVLMSSQASINPHEIITESMAEVWIEQGIPSKAREIYHKLSLLFPNKLAYFADKLNHLPKEDNNK